MILQFEDTFLKYTFIMVKIISEIKVVYHGLLFIYHFVHWIQKNHTITIEMLLMIISEKKTNKIQKVFS